jgi:hypothetical protein
MFEIGDIVAYRKWDWTHCQFHPDKWVIIDRDHIHLQYDDYVWEYTIQNQETGEVITNVTDIQIKNFYE